MSFFSGASSRNFCIIHSQQKFICLRKPTSLALKGFHCWLVVSQLNTRVIWGIYLYFLFYVSFLLWASEYARLTHAGHYLRSQNKAA